jgi:hypothetical protein
LSAIGPFFEIAAKPIGFGMRKSSTRRTYIQRRFERPEWEYGLGACRGRYPAPKLRILFRREREIAAIHH